MVAPYDTPHGARESSLSSAKDVHREPEAMPTMRRNQRCSKQRMLCLQLAWPVSLRPAVGLRGSRGDLGPLPRTDRAIGSRACEAWVGRASGPLAWIAPAATRLAALGRRQKRVLALLLRLDMLDFEFGV